MRRSSMPSRSPVHGLLTSVSGIPRRPFSVVACAWVRTEPRTTMARTLGTRMSRKRQGYSNAVEGSFKVGVILYDLRHAARRLLRNWRFACVAVVTLGVGVGVLTALFAVVHAVLLRPVASDQGRLVRVWKDDVAHGMGRHSLSYD